MTAALAARTYVERSELAAFRFIYEIDVLDERTRRSAFTKGSQGEQALAIAFGDALDRAVIAVAHPTDDAQRPRSFQHRRSEEHALDAASYDRM